VEFEINIQKMEMEGRFASLNGCRSFRLRSTTGVFPLKSTLKKLLFRLRSTTIFSKENLYATISTIDIVEKSLSLSGAEATSFFHRIPISGR